MHITLIFSIKWFQFRLFQELLKSRISYWDYNSFGLFPYHISEKLFPSTLRQFLLVSYSVLRQQRQVGILLV